jgi:two-component SAPR family response regulator
MKFLKQAIQIAESGNYKIRLADQYYLAGRIAAGTDEPFFQKAPQFLTKAYKIFNSLNNKRKVFLIIEKLEYYFRQTANSKAELFWRNRLAHCLGDPFRKKVILSSLSEMEKLENLLYAEGREQDFAWYYERRLFLRCSKGLPRKNTKASQQAWNDLLSAAFAKQEHNEMGLAWEYRLYFGKLTFSEPYEPNSALKIHLLKVLLRHQPAMIYPPGKSSGLLDTFLKKYSEKLLSGEEALPKELLTENEQILLTAQLYWELVNAKGKNKNSPFLEYLQQWIQQKEIKVSHPYQIESIQIKSFGSFRMTINGMNPPAEYFSAQPRRLLAYMINTMAVNKTESLDRDQIVEALWPDGSDADKLEKRFRQAVYSINRAVSEQVYIENSDENKLIISANALKAFQINLQDYTHIDLFTFMESYRRGNKAILAGDDVAAAYSYEMAVQLFSDDYLTDFDEEWVQNARQLIHQAMQEMVRFLCQHSFRQKNYKQTIHQAQRYIRFFPNEEQAMGWLIKALVADGQQIFAHIEYNNWKNRLEKGLGIDVGAFDQYLKFLFVDEKKRQ